MTLRNIAISMLKMGKNFEEVVRDTDYSLEKVAEFNELMLYERGKYES